MKTKAIAVVLVLAVLLVSAFSVASFAQPVSVPAPRLPIHSISYGEIGVYKNEVYIEMPMVLPAIRLGDHVYVMKRTTTVSPVPVKGIRPLFITAAWLVVGEVNSSYAVNYTLSHVGQKITIFPPASFTFNSSPITPFIVVLPGLSVTVLDVGNFTSKPSGVFTVLYVPARVSQPSPKPYSTPQPHPIPMFNTTKPIFVILSARDHALRLRI